AGAWVILQAAGGCWISLKNQPFPLISGTDYSNIPFPTMVVSNAQMESVFTPFLTGVKL
ncbi:MAG: inositol monophosphatase, partial [Sphaerospermopsis sp. SIO1G2]|nr:inositol monophosphatase [Sphaerospermopsis sp. SIO1G2]